MADVQATLPPLAAPPPPALPDSRFGRLRLSDPHLPSSPAAAEQQQQLQPPQCRHSLGRPPDGASDTTAAASTSQPPPQARTPIHLRHTASSRSHSTVDPESDSAAAIRALLRRDPADRGVLPPLGAVAGAAPADYAAAARHCAENVREMVARKRQIFLAQMSLDTKYSEIAKLEARAAQREEALVASEQALDADSQRFEEYLKENDAKLQEALKRADAEARARGEKAAEAKRVSGAIAGLRAEMGKIEEQLGECKRYKDFLDSVTPAEWFETLEASRAAKKAALRAAWAAECAAIADRKAEAAAAKQRAEHDMQWARTQQQFERAERAHREAAAALREALAVQDPPEPEYAAVDAEDGGMHFTDPSQLLAVFSQLEGSNMFQIQTAQDAEAALETAKASAEAAEAEAAAQAAALARQVGELEAAIGAARERCARLRAAAAGEEAAAGTVAGAAAGKDTHRSTSEGEGRASGDGGDAGQASSAAALAERLVAAYEAAGFARDASVTPLQMLQKVEGRLEELLAAVGPPGSPAALAAEAVERAREKERRQAARAGKLAAQQAEHEARVARVLARAAAPKFQRSGKPAMTRSVLVRQQRRSGGEADEGEAEELAAFLALVDEGLLE